MSKKSNRQPSVVFYYDVVCPYAYLASQRIESIAERNGARVEWRPTLLGGVYEATKAPQGKDGSASDVMPANKKALSARDLQLQLKRFGVPLNWHPQHPVKSVDALRLLIAVPDAHRPALSHALFKAYWVDNKDVSDRAVLLDIAARVLRLDENSKNELAVAVAAEKVKAALHQHTAEAVEKGAPGVPAFVVGDKLFWGQDRLHFVDKALGNANAAQPRFFSAPPGSSPVKKPNVLTFYYDFSSPWSYLGHSQLDRIVREAPKGTVLEAVPILLGAIFKEIGTPNVPMLAMSNQKRQYLGQDMLDWQNWWSPAVTLNWPTKFPIRSVLPLRVATAEPRVRHAIYQAGWVDNEDIADPAVLAAVLDKAGFHGADLVKAADSDAVKKQLIANTKRAVDAGVIGVPSFQVNDGDVIWGQDRLDLVQDLLAGWQPFPAPLDSKL